MRPNYDDLLSTVRDLSKSCEFKKGMVVVGITSKIIEGRGSDVYELFQELHFAWGGQLSIGSHLLWEDFEQIGCGGKRIEYHGPTNL